MRHFLLILVIAIAGPIFFFKGCSSLVRGTRSNAWPTAEARVYSSKVVMNPGSKGSRHYSPEIRYAFTVDGHEYVSDQVAFSKDWSQAEAVAMKEKHAVGTSMTVHHDPEDPAQSVIISGRSEGGWFMVGISVVMLGIVALNSRSAWLKVREVMDGNLG
jgi:hypothetical protein